MSGRSNLAGGDMHIAYKLAVLIASFSFLVTCAASAQMNGFSTNNFGGATIHGTPPSVTSFGFGGRPGFHGVPPSVTSLNFGNVPFSHPRFGLGPKRVGVHNHFRNGFFPYFSGGYYIPYAYDYADPGYTFADTGVDDSMEENYQGGPTIFDRRRPGMPDYARPRSDDDYRAELNAEQQKAPQPGGQEPVAEQPSTVLIFKDGHELEVKNYAIVGATLYDLSDGRARKVELAQLDLPATVKHNDDRGVSFQLPAGTKLN